MKLYHGTSALYLPEILEQGIHPRGKLPSKKAGNWAGTVRSNPKAVYLTNAYPIHFATNAVGNSKAQLAVFEIETAELETMLFAPDEDLMEQGTRKDPNFAHVPGTDPFDMKKRTKWFRERALSHYAAFWPLSLEHMGTCTYYGTIPPEAITAYVTWPADHPLTFASDPTITPLNYKIMGPYYRDLTRLMFALPLQEQDSMFEHYHKLFKDPRMLEGVTLVADDERHYNKAA